MSSAPARPVGLAFQPVERGRDLEPVGRQVLLRSALPAAGPARRAAARSPPSGRRRGPGAAARSSARRGRAGNSLGPACSVSRYSQITREVVERGAVVEHQRRDLVERIHRHDVGVGVVRAHHHALGARCGRPSPASCAATITLRTNGERDDQNSFIGRTLAARRTALPDADCSRRRAPEKQTAVDRRLPPRASMADRHRQGRGERSMPGSGEVSAQHLSRASRARRARLPGQPEAGKAVFYPRVLCPVTGSGKLEWRGRKGLGTVYSTTVVHPARASAAQRRADRHATKASA